MPHRVEAALTRDEVNARVRRILMEQLEIDADRLLPTTKIPDLGGDSIGTLELTVALEDEFDLEFPDAVLDRLQTVQDVTDYLTTRLGID